ncbi:MAG: thioredoxin family protein [Polyangiaceae bacterium]|nr:thioredoxin family protein [Polyangiaceae bacterium]
MIPSAARHLFFPLALAACGPTRSEPTVPVVTIPSSAPAGTAPSPIAGPAPPSKPSPPARAMEWARDEPEARARARRDGRPLLVYLRADWSAASLAMDRDVWSDPRAIAEARPFVAVLVDLTSAEGDAELYAQRYGVSAVPAIALFDRDGRPAGLLAGARGVDEVAAALRRAAERDER